MAIDEFRKDFVRVPWGGTNLPLSYPGQPIAFEQIWFAGNHSDIGGSYPENESRLSDISLDWMTKFIEQEIPVEARVLINHEVLKLFPCSDGIMHDECMIGIGGTPLKWYPTDRDVPHDAILHSSVYERLEMTEVRNFVSTGQYRPATLRNHDKAKQYFEVPQVPTSQTSGG